MLLSYGGDVASSETDVHDFVGIDARRPPDLGALLRQQGRTRARSRAHVVLVEEREAVGVEFACNVGGSRPGNALVVGAADEIRTVAAHAVDVLGALLKVQNGGAARARRHRHRGE